MDKNYLFHNFIKKWYINMYFYICVDIGKNQFDMY